VKIKPAETARIMFRANYHDDKDKTIKLKPFVEDTAEAA